ncbi:MAG: alpha/beta fold hydrolase [Leptolyngbyaceae cyanobacterium bins.349]|nr:alpha/beta fold hydrolase [Leptolyngbyaceae cyanobacterium bins.349]
MKPSPAWHHQVGHQRDWVWRGWRTRYTYLRAQQDNQSAPMILLHGFGASIGHWRQNLPTLGQHHTVYALDMLGFGASEKVTAPYGIEFWVEQVYDFWQTFVRQPVILVGNSIGSLICLAVAAQHPDMVRAIVMLNLPDSSVLESPKWLSGALSCLHPVTQPLLGAVKWVVTLPPVFNTLFWAIRQPAMLRLWAKQAYATPSAITDELIDIFSSPAYERGAARTLRAMVNGKPTSTSLTAKVSYAAKDVLPQLQMPILLFWGLKDKMVPPALARRFLKYSASLELVEIEEAGHCPHDEHPELVNREIIRWIAQWQR